MSSSSRSLIALVAVVVFSLVVFMTSSSQPVLPAQSSSPPPSTVTEVQSPRQEEADGTSITTTSLQQDAGPPSLATINTTTAEYRYPSFSVPNYELDAFPTLHRHIIDASRRAFSLPEIPLLLPSTTESLSSSSSSSSSLFETNYQKIECGAVVSNLCVWGGQPRYFRKGSKLFSSTGATRVCNEAETKLRFHMVVQEPVPISAPKKNILPAPYQHNTLLLAAMCWELYGYHLFLCLLNNYGVLSQLKFPAKSNAASPPPPPRVKVVLLKTWSGESSLGSPKSWDEESSSSSSSSSSKSPFWGWWRVLVDRPSDVVMVNSLPPTCAPYGVVAGRADLTPALQQKFRSEMLRRFGIDDTKCDEKTMQIRITVVDRETKFQLKNSAELAEQFSDAVRQQIKQQQQQQHHHLEQQQQQIEIISRVIIFEKLPSLSEQIRVAASTDILVGMHGNGLTWTAFMKPSHDRGTALVELWPSHVYNANYAHIAGRANVRRWSVAAGIANCPKRCPAAIPVPKETLQEVAEFVVGGAVFRLKKKKKGCSSSLSSPFFSGDREHVKYQAEYAAKKKNKKRAKLQDG